MHRHTHTQQSRYACYRTHESRRAPHRIKRKITCSGYVASLSRARSPPVCVCDLARSFPNRLVAVESMCKCVRARTRRQSAHFALPDDDAASTLAATHRVTVIDGFCRGRQFALPPVTTPTTPPTTTPTTWPSARSRSARVRASEIIIIIIILFLLHIFSLHRCGAVRAHFASHRGA